MEAEVAFGVLLARFPRISLALRPSELRLLWPLTELDSNHLAPLTEPGRVTGALLDLLDRIGVGELLAERGG
jgi:hypothetical protein